MKRAARSRRAAKILRRILTILVVTVFTLWAISAAAVLIWSSRDEARPAQAIVVLGAAQYAGKPSPVLRARLDHAIELWRAKLAPFLIVTGGRGSGDTTSEAAVERRYAITQGVPPNSIWLEDGSRTTSEALRNVA